MHFTWTTLKLERNFEMIVTRDCHWDNFANFYNLVFEYIKPLSCVLTFNKPSVVTSRLQRHNVIMIYHKKTSSWLLQLL